MSAALRKKLLDGLSKALVGAEKLAPEVEESVRKLVTSTGRINEKALANRRFGGNLLLGQKGALDAVKARYRQGGAFGPGGVVMGELAVDPRYKKLVKELVEAKGTPHIVDPYTGKLISRNKAMAKVIGKGATESINPAFLLGFPALEMYDATKNPDYLEEGGYSGLLGALGSGVGFMAGGPLGLVGGMGASMLGQNLGASIGGRFDPKKNLLNVTSPTAQATIPKASDLILDAAV